MGFLQQREAGFSRLQVDVELHRAIVGFQLINLASRLSSAGLNRPRRSHKPRLQPLQQQAVFFFLVQRPPAGA